MQKRARSKKGVDSRRKFLGNVAKGLGIATLGTSLDSNVFARHQTSYLKNISTGRAGQFGFVIHGGAGTITKSSMTAELEKAYRNELMNALTIGYDILRRGGASLDAVEAAILPLEDSPLFNAGKGAVFTNAGTNELDASIMDGRTLKAGAVASLKHIKNPISLARLVMEKSPHVMMVSDGAESFAKQQGIAFVPQSYFYTEKRWKEWQQEKADELKQQQQQQGVPVKEQQHVKTHTDTVIEKHGTVGAAALDKNGNLAAGTSTGGLTNKKFGRVGDSPIIGAGTYANNLTCAISATGDGEYFMRSVVAHDISALMQYGGKSLREAAQLVIEKVGRLGGTGGIIGIDKDGNIAQVFNTEGMYRARVGADGKMIVEIYKD